MEAPAQVRFNIDQGLTNSYSTDPITPFIIRTLDSLSDIIDEGYSTAIEYTPNEISAVQVTACSD